jgi:hypothetical protein
VSIELPSNVTITATIAGRMGGIVLWHDLATSRGG